MRSNIQYIYLDSTHKQLSITKEGYEQIRQTIERYRVCCHCGNLFTEENPQVSLNWCKKCFPVYHGRASNYGFTYIGMVSPEPKQYSGIEHKWITEDGYVYVTGSDAEITHDMGYYNKNKRQTLKHWQFPAPPELYPVNGEETRLHDNHIEIYGDVRKDAVVLLNYSETYTYAPSVNLVFLAYRHAETCQEFSKRKGDGRKVWRAAKARLEATKDAHGDYHINGYARSWTHETDPYYFVVDILNEQEERKALEQRKASAAQLISQDIKPGEPIQLSLTAYEEARLQQLQERQQ